MPDIPEVEMQVLILMVVQVVAVPVLNQLLVDLVELMEMTVGLDNQVEHVLVAVEEDLVVQELLEDLELMEELEPKFLQHSEAHYLNQDQVVEV